MDDQLRALGRAARAEVEAGLDLDAELAAVRRRTPSDLAPRPTTDERRARRGATVWLAAAAAAVVAVVGGIWLLGNDDAAIQTAEPETTLGTTMTTAPTATPDSAAPSTVPGGARTGQIRGGQDPGDGRFDAVTGDLIERRADGTLWLRRDFATDPSDPGVRLLDDQYSLDGMNGVAVVSGSLWWSDCCEPILGNVWAVNEVDGERGLITYGTQLRLSPDGTVMASLGADTVGFVDVASRESIGSVEMTNVMDLQWTADGTALLVLRMDDSALLLSRVESPTDPVRTATIEIGVVLPSAASTPPWFAGMNDSVVALAAGDSDEVLRFFDPTTLDEIDADHPWDLPSDARSVQFAPDGESLVYVADDGLHRIDGFGTDVLVAEHVTAAWYPVVSGATIAPMAPGAGICTDIKAHDVGVGGIADLVVDARLAGRPPAIDGCLETIPAEFDGSPSRCWACAGLEFADLPVRVAETESGFSFDLAVSTPDGNAVTDTTETWRFDLADNGLRFGGVTFAEPLVSRADSLATITTYLEAVEAGDWMAVAQMLDDGAQNAEERADLQRLELTDHSYESVAAALEAWCDPGCWTERPALAELEFNGYSHDLVRFGERIRVRWHEGYLSIDGLPPRLPDEPAAETVDWRDLTWETTTIEHSCVRASLNCTSVIHATDGTPISYDPNSRELVRHSIPPVSTQLPDEYGVWPWLYHAGPDGVVYLQVEPAVPAELAADIVAITLADGDAGREIGRWAGVADNVGDTELVATPDGLVNVNCCGPDFVRPAPDAEVLVPWIDRTGATLTTSSPTIRVTIDHPSMTVARTDRVPAGTREWTVTPAGVWQPRGMPQVIATFDGGFIAATPGAGSSDTTIIRGWPNGDVEQVVVADILSVDLDRSGRFLLGDGERFVRVEPFADRTSRPGEQAQIDFAAGTVSLPDLSGISANWLSDPIALTDAVRGPLDANNQRTITAEQLSELEWRVIVTTSNFFDDSVFADRWELVLNRGDDGRFTLVSGQWSQACQPGRGHQDFGTELCV